ncbi:MAG: prepilin-type N-terminal cleavage/methylation domain-containing protein [Candidatus Shapirobacteria bacterium]|nr:prepilin-type N-terminal cleavage/methylation domain-containing protein [Candidatus Shapirobacteria bacterium]
MLKQKNIGVTLIEWLIVIAIISILLIIIFAHINPLRERDRASDSRRKADLNRINIALEEFYSDHDCYPIQEIFNQNEGLRPYLGQTPRDPGTGLAYFYFPQEEPCPQYYRLYTNLRWQDDPDITKIGCSTGCGPDNFYNYGVSSPDTSLVIVTELATGCYNQSNCTICQENEEGLCMCNAVGRCCVEFLGDCPSGCDQCFPANLCFFDGNCGGYRNNPMPSY